MMRPAIHLLDNRPRTVHYPANSTYTQMDLLPWVMCAVSVRGGGQCAKLNGKRDTHSKVVENQIN